MDYFYRFLNLQSEVKFGNFMKLAHESVNMLTYKYSFKITPLRLNVIFNLK